MKRYLPEAGGSGKKRGAFGGGRARYSRPAGFREVGGDEGLRKSV